jgi:hypothetical protein
VAALRAVYDENDSTRRRRRRVEASRGLDRLESTNVLLHYIVVSSERWDRPSLSTEQLQELYDFGPFSVDMRAYRSYYCAFVDAPECSTASRPHRSVNATFYYDPIQYQNDTALIITDNASALLFSGGLDFATPAEFTQLLYEALAGGAGRMLVTFDYGTHCNGEATEKDDTMSCYWSILFQFILAGGDVTTVDTSCMASLPSLQFRV